MTTATTHRPIHEVIYEIRAHWSKPYFGAEPYLGALEMLSEPTDYYYEDRADHLIIYLLSNMTTFKGEAARRLKAELKAIAASAKGKR